MEQSHSDEKVEGDKDAEAAPLLADTHESLKYHLLGPSLTKAGQNSVDQQKVSEVIYNASKGSKFFNHEQSRDEVLTEKIQRILERKRILEGKDLSRDIRNADNYISQLELGRDLSQTVVHIDCDAFFAAVEELERPELREVPMAVGKGVLTTCNYHARKFGVRSGMASFIAKKLCPDLTLLPQNYEKYTAKAEEIRSILRKYDPNFQSASIDEAYMNITEYCSTAGIGPEEAIQQLRDEIREETKVTVSAGIAANARIAKICSNWNKPNGQYFVPSERTAIMDFMATIPVRKINGVGRVFERELEAIGVKECKDIFTHRGILAQLFGQKAFQFLIQCYLGLGRTKIQPVEEHERKSVSTESTFRDMEGIDRLQEKLRQTADELAKDMQRLQLKGRTLGLKVKLHTFEILSRQVVPPKAVHKADDLYNYALPMLSKLNREVPNMKLRLMGLRCSNLVSTKGIDINFFGNTRRSEYTATTTGLREEHHGDGDFETLENARDDECSRDGEECSQDAEDTSKQSSPLSWECPICLSPQAPDDPSFNQHLDYCLSKQTIKEAVKGSLQECGDSSMVPGKRKSPFDSPASNGARKRPFFFS